MSTFHASSYANLASSQSTHRPWPAASSSTVPEPQQQAEVPVVNVCPRRADGPDDEGFFSLGRGNDAAATFWQWTARPRPVRRDGAGGLSEFFAAGSPTFRKTADPFLIGCATVGGLVVLGTVLSV